MTYLAITWLACIGLVLELAHRAPIREDLE